MSSGQSSVRLISTGQAGFILKSENDQSLGIDLYLSDYVERVEGSMGFKRLLPKLYLPDELKTDVLITTHFHADHYDKDSVPVLMKHPNTILYASECCREMIKEQKIDHARVEFVHPGDVHANGDFEIHFVDCDHGEAAPHAVGVVVCVNGKIIYEVGDSCFRPDIAERIREQFSVIDVLIGPINGAYGNMNESELARFASIITPGLVIPCHYGMFASHGGNPGKFFDIMNREYPNQRMLLMTQGEELTV